MPSKTCFFIGHRTAPPDLLPRLVEAVERHVTDYGITEFIVGSHGSFDHLAAQAVRDVKKRHPDITLTRLLAYYRADRPEQLPPGYDGSLYPDGLESTPRRFAITYANRWMARRCDCLIAYDRGYPGNTQAIVRLARARERKGLARVENLGEEI